jgi:transposase
MKKGIKIGIQLQESNTELNKLNQRLSDMNDELKKINLEIKEANHVKEEYIGYFLDECSKYIEKLDQYRKMVNKKLKDKEVNELFRITQKNDLKEEELKELFSNFDVIFIHLFPNFIEDFNALLYKSEQIISKKGEELTTELRIYALIRLGLDDNGKIANFLGYSINTIYNYRARMRNKAKIPKEDFEWTVRRIGTFIR